jgi:hypothetical protein
MAQFNFPIKIIPLWKNKTLSAGDSATSDPVDTREVARAGVFSLSSSVAAGTAGTTGTTVFTYSGCSRRDGTYVTPSAAVAIGTNGTQSAADIKSFNPVLMPFIKIIATQTGTGTAGKDSKVTAELNVQ